MPQGIKYNINTGVVTGQVSASSTNDFKAQATNEHGVLEYSGEIDDVWVKEGKICPREELVIPDLPETVLLGTEIKIDVPKDCILVNEMTILKNGTIVASELGVLCLRFIGKYKGPDILINVVASLNPA